MREGRIWIGGLLPRGRNRSAPCPGITECRGRLVRPARGPTSVFHPAAPCPPPLLEGATSTASTSIARPSAWPAALTRSATTSCSAPRSWLDQSCPGIHPRQGCPIVSSGHQSEVPAVQHPVSCGLRPGRRRTRPAAHMGAAACTSGSCKGHRECGLSLPRSSAHYCPRMLTLSQGAVLVTVREPEEKAIRAELIRSIHESACLGAQVWTRPKEQVLRVLQ